MLAINIPGRGQLELDYLVLDLNGTISADGVLIEGVSERVRRLAEGLQIYLVTADTLDTAAELATALGAWLHKLQPEDEPEQKRVLLQTLGPHRVAAIGNGANDVLMLRAAALGVAVMGPEGLSVQALTAADVLAPDILAALDLLLKPERLIATWRK